MKGTSLAPSELEYECVSLPMVGRKVTINLIRLITTMPQCA